MAINNPYVPGDPYSYDLKWIVAKLKTLISCNDSAQAAAESAAKAEAAAAAAQSGLLREYDTVAAMAGDSSLIVGSMVFTKGYYAVNDGGAAAYLIVASSSGLYETVANGVAELICDNIVNIRQIGAKSGDPAFDNSAVISKAIDYISANYPVSNLTGDRKTGGGIVIVPEGTFYCLTQIDLGAHHNITIKGTDRDSSIIYCTVLNQSVFYHYPGESTGIWNFHIENITFTGGDAVNLIAPYGLKISNCNFYNIPTTAVMLYLTVGAIIEKCHFYECYYGVILSGAAGVGPSTTLLVNECWFAHNNRAFYGIFNHAENYCKDIVIKNSIFEYNTDGVYLVGNTTNACDITLKDIFFEGNTNPSVASVNFSTCMKNCTFDTAQGDTCSITPQSINSYDIELDQAGVLSVTLSSIIACQARIYAPDIICDTIARKIMQKTKSINIYDLGMDKCYVRTYYKSDDGCCFRQGPFIYGTSYASDVSSDSTAVMNTNASGLVEVTDAGATDFAMYIDY